MRTNVPAVFCSGGPMRGVALTFELVIKRRYQDLGLANCLSGWRYGQGKSSIVGENACPTWFMFRDVYR